MTEGLKQGLFLVRRREKEALIHRLTKSWYPTTKFIVQIYIFVHEGMARCLIKSQRFP
jgi:hypothetical protein